MTNRLSIIFGTFLIIAICSDVFANDSQALIFLGKKLLKLIEYVAFWR